MLAELCSCWHAVALALKGQGCGLATGVGRAPNGIRHGENGEDPVVRHESLPSCCSDPLHALGNVAQDALRSRALYTCRLTGSRRGSTEALGCCQGPKAVSNPTQLEAWPSSSKPDSA